MGEPEGAPIDVKKIIYTCDHLAEPGPSDLLIVLREAQDLVGFSIREVDVRSGRARVSENYAKVFGFAAPVSAQAFAERIHPEDRNGFETWRQGVFNTVGRSTRIFRIQGGEDDVRWIESRSQTLAGADGLPERVLITSRDITRYRYMDMELSDSAERLQRAGAAGRVGTWETDFSSGTENWSPEAWALIEPGGRGDASCERWLAAVHPDDRERAWRATEEALDSGNGHYHCEFRVVHPDASIHWLRSTATIQRNSAGQSSVMRGAVIDITEYVQSQEALSRLAKIIESTTDFVGWADPDGRAVYVNPAGREMCGLSPGESVAGMSVLDFVAPHHHGLMLGEVRGKTHRDGLWKGELDMVDRSGRIFPVSKVSVLHKDSFGEPLYMSTVSRDISHEKQVEESLREADRRKDEFLATLAHELRNPLTPLQSVADALKQIEGDSAPLARIRRTIEQQTAHLTRLVEDLVDVSRLTSGKLVLECDRTDVGSVIGNAVDMCRREIDTRKQTLTIDVPASPIAIRADSVRLTQVLANLIGNAAKYTQKGGRIDVRASCDRDNVVIAVEDNGLGIEPDFLPKVFDMFAQAPDQRQRAAGGLGLGLMLVKQIVELHGGIVEAGSDGRGKGARFVVQLPRGLDVPLVEPAHVDLLDPSTISGMRVLVVDDYAAIRDSMALMLGLRGVEVETAPDGLTAIEKAAAFQPDAMILDVRMPGMNGYEVARAIRRSAALAEIKLIAMTGDGTPNDIAGSLDAGFDAHLVKPAPVGDLIRVLARARQPKRAVA